MVTQDQLEHIAAGMYANRKTERLSPYLIRWVLHSHPWFARKQRRLTISLIVTCVFQTVATLQFTEWCARSWSTERRAVRFLAVCV